MTRLLVSLSALGLVVVGAALASAQQSPSAEKPGRFTMQAVEGGFLRLDTDSGAVSLCAKRSDGFACEPVRDEKKQTELQREVERLTAENARLKDDVKRLEDLVTSDPKIGGERHAERKFQLPSEKDIDEAMSYFERMYKKFRDRLKDLEGSTEKKGTPL